MLGPNDVYVVPKDVQRCPKAEVEMAIDMLKIQGTVNTSDAGGDRTVQLQGLEQSDCPCGIRL